MSDEIKRRSDGRFAPGQSGNPEGKGKNKRTAADFNKAVRDEVSIEEFQELTRIMVDHIRETGSIRAYEALANRLCGKPVQVEMERDTNINEELFALLSIRRTDQADSENKPH